MPKPKKDKKSTHTLVRLGPKLDAAVTVLGAQNTMSYAATVRMLVLLGVRGLIRSGTFQGWIIPEELERSLDSPEVKVSIRPGAKKGIPASG